ncbi:hypothetical protein RD055328_08650 [Companilactobacillus sp. RD055328]|uniref:hypothetical protein n=1 Tax=Companilactobacillus sp. RD055328 TaxID=2916634 RepID=UPI001FC7BF6F|nr:hypothetical protein [Companilactobacillus sp. RD055328]GKQ42942.1 hypothetical protein RD055328_08650 [Companilactobacillus sp. RD055328]
MSIMDRVKNVQETYNPETDSINSYEGLKDGSYNVVAASIARSDYDQLSVKAEVIEGDNAGMSEFINLGLDELKQDGSPLPDFVIDRNIKTISKLAYVLGVNISDEAWDDMGVLVETFKEATGKQFTMELKLGKNKKNPSRPYKNYDFEKLEGDPLADNSQPIDISDEDMPF